MSRVALYIDSVDCSNYALKMPDIDACFSNFDYSLKLPSMQMELANAVTDVKTPVAGLLVNIFQDDYLIMPGFINDVKYDGLTMKYIIKLKHIIEKLDVQILEDTYKTGLDAALYPSRLDGDGHALYPSFFEGSNQTYLGLWRYLFQNLTGYDVDIPLAWRNGSDGTYYSTSWGKVFLWNMGCTKISGVSTYRDNQNLISWLKLLSYEILNGIMLYWDPNLEKFAMRRGDTTGSDTRPILSAATAWGYSESYYNFDKVANYSTPPTGYIETESGSYRLKDYTNSTTWGIMRYTPESGVAASNGVETASDNSVFRTAGWYDSPSGYHFTWHLVRHSVGNRASSSPILLKKHTIPAFYDLQQYTAVSEMKYVFKSGIYNMSITVIDEV